MITTTYLTTYLKQFTQFEKDFTFDRVLSWVNHQPAIDIIGMAYSFDACPLANYLAEQDGQDWVILRNEAYLADQPHLAFPLPVWAIRVVEETNRFAGGYWPITVEQFGSFLDSVHRQLTKESAQ